MIINHQNLTGSYLKMPRKICSRSANIILLRNENILSDIDDFLQHTNK